MALPPMDRLDTSSALQDGAGVVRRVTRREWCYPPRTPREGPLVQDRTHVFKAFLTFLPVDRTCTP